MPVLDAVFIGKIHLPEIGGGPIYPQPPQPGGPVVMPPIYYPSPPVDPGYGIPITGRPIVSPPIYYPPYPDHGLPPYPSHPIAYPPGQPPVPSHPWVPPAEVPEHPIVLPPDAVPPTMPPHPAHPIAGVEYGYALIYIPGYGMKWVAFPVHPDEAPPPA